MDPVVIKVGYLVRAGGNLPAGAEGQIVGYGAGGVPVAVDPPSGVGYDDTAIQEQIAALTTRIAALEGGQPVLTAPAAFTPDQWSVSTGLEAFQIVVSITELPSDGGSEITELQYDAGAGWVSLVGVDTGPRTLIMSGAGTAYDVQIRAVNAIDPGPASATKSATSGAEAIGGQFAATGMYMGATTTDSTMVSVYTEPGAETVQVFAVPVGGGAEIASDQVAVTEIEAVNPATFYPSTNYGVARCMVQGQQPDVEYEFGVRVNGQVTAGMTGRARTRPTTRKAFTFGFGTCFELNASRGYANFDVMAAQDVDFFAVLDDRGYSDITVNDPRLYYRADWGLLHHPKIGPFHRAFSIYNIPGDHDFGANNSSASSAGKPAFMQWYRNHAPQPVTLTGALDPVDYAVWIAPDLKLVMPDTRTNRSGNMFMDADQEARFIAHVQEVGAIPGACMIWNSGTPWISYTYDSDTWYGAQAQRQRIADAVLQYAPGRVAIICGDMHALAFDDGTNSAGGMPVFHAAPMARSNSSKGGPYTGGDPIQATQYQYGQMDCTPVTGGWQLSFRGYSCDAVTGEQTLQITGNVTLQAPSAPVDEAPAFTGTSTITGGSAEGQTLTADPGTYTGAPTPAVSYQWRLDGVDQSGETAATFVRPAGVGTVPSVVITLDNDVEPNATRTITADATTEALAVPTYQQAVLDAAPQFLLMNPDGATIPDETGNGRDATIVGTQGTQIAGGPFGLPAFRGTASCHAQVAHDAAFNGTSWSVAFFVHPNNVNDVVYLGYFHRGGDQKLSVNYTDPLLLDVRYGATNAQTNVDQILNPATWNFVAITFDAETGRGRIYSAQDGGDIALRNEATVASSLQSSTDPVVFNGRVASGSVSRRGATAHAGMARWDRELSLADLTAIYQAAKNATT